MGEVVVTWMGSVLCKFQLKTTPFIISTVCPATLLGLCHTSLFRHHVILAFKICSVTSLGESIVTSVSHGDEQRRRNLGTKST